jgi:hypothetical protein
MECALDEQQVVGVDWRVLDLEQGFVRAGLRGSGALISVRTSVGCRMRKSGLRA